ncbi:uncharacterized protein LOC118349890 [Juglans regia]|uniref:Uncharacterized protein LOC118349890 n=1 Tax=Juglans regia TaxID=51240 RepID=A0A6P9EWW1_JUGRE|nr:uncharacterized protein LOC118349890 [Juglans regia]
MKILSWNTRGLGNPRGIRTLADLLRREDPDVLFLQETKLNAAKMEFYRVRFKFNCCLTVDAVGRSGGLALLWKQDVPLSILSYSASHIDAMLEGPQSRRGGAKPFRFEAMWIGETECSRIIQQEWLAAISSNGMQGVMDCIYSCSSKLQRWNKSKFGKVQVKLKEAKHKLSMEQSQEVILDKMERKVSHEMNVELIKSFTAVEVLQALKEMHPNKAPGPDVLNHGEMPQALNHTFITLVPKKKSPQTVNDLRPISLCNVAYKLIFKVIANRIKQVLLVIISDTQSSFIPGRLITDNVLVAYEVLHYLKRKKKGKKGFMSIKLDMSKAYDRVEWSFIESVMSKLGFHEKLIQLVMMCVRTPTFSILINGSPTGLIVPSRGLRQGDPISPYLFLLCTEGLISLLREAERTNVVTGLQICHGAPKLNHLLFADDSLIFCNADMETNVRLQTLLEQYEVSSGQQLNREKTTMVFSANVNQHNKQAIMNLWCSTQLQHYDKYLGLPPVVGKSKSRAFASIKHKVWLKLQGWKGNMFSQGGKEILLKAVAMAIPSYAMSCFKLPPRLCSKIESMMARYWWGQKQEERNIHCLSWKKMCNLKFVGGMGFKELEVFNMALLAKQAWRLLQNQDISLGGNPSYAWRGIWEAKRLLVQGGRWNVGNGSLIHILNDVWIPGFRNLRQALGNEQSIEHSSQLDNQVFSLIDQSTKWWDIAKVRALFNPNMVEAILRLHPSHTGAADHWMWEHEKSGSFSIKSAYSFFKTILESEHGESSSGALMKKFRTALWKLQVPHKVKVFAWRACKDSLPTKANLIKRKLDIEGKCCFCQHPFEDLRWSTPPEDSLKLNIDGALFFDLNKAGMGAVLRNHMGEILMACSRVESVSLEPEQVEAVALLRGLQLCMSLGIPKLIIESDCLFLVEEVNRSSESNAAI